MRKKICIALMAAFTVLLGVSSYFIIDHYREAEHQEQMYDSLVQLVEDSETEPAEPIIYSEDKTILPELTELYRQNDDLVGWICVEDTNINYPVMQTVDNPNYYLKRGFDKEYSSYGCPYVQENCDVLKPSDNLVIYGHHMNNGSMFADLEKFKDEDFWREHKTIAFNTLTEKNEYEILAVFKTVVYTDSPEAFKYYRFTDAQSPEEFEVYIDKCKELSLYDTGVSAEYGDKLITLSTCEYSRTNGRLVVVAKKVTESAVKRVEKGMMKANRTRNLFAVFAIVLTTFMITTVFSLGINYMENMKLMQVRTAGTTADVSLAMPTAEQEQQIKDLEYVKTVGTQYMVGSVAEKNDEGRELSIAIQYYDTTEWEKHYQEAIKDLEGKYPASENEIMLSEDALSQLGITDPKLNMEIPLSYYDKNGQQEKTFTLSGWFHSYTGTGMGFVSEAYCKNAGYTMAQDGVLSLSLNKMPDDFHRIQKDVELNENQSFSGAVSMKSSSGSVIAMVVLLVFFIIGSGYLLIYNVLYISISKDTRFYGLMKTLGTTQVQIKSLVKNQALKFACIGIPIGIVLATAVSFGIVPFVLNEGFEQGKSIMDAEMFFHPSIYILSVIFSAITVWIACNAPAKAAAKISPVEALKFQNFAPKKTKSRNSTNGGKLHIMAFHNVFRDKKRAILVFMSLFMGITMILGVNGVIGSMNAENFIKEYMDYHFEYNDIQFEQPEQPNKEVPQFDEHFVEQIQQVNGIENVDVQKTVWAGIDFDENALEGFMKIQYEDSRYKSKGQSYEQMIEALKGYADDGEYGCYITTLDDDKALEECGV